MRQRYSSSTNPYEEDERHHATEYFDSVMEKMEALREVLESSKNPELGQSHNHTFDRDNRIIDYVLVYDKTSRRPSKDKVNHFLRHLVKEGFATEGGESEIYEHLIFIRIHCHRTKLIKAAVALDIQLTFLNKYEDKYEADNQVFFNFDFLFNDLTRPKALSDIAQRARETAFNIKPRDITNPERIMVTHELLKNTKFGEDDDEFGINSLINKGHLHCAFPLHDGDWEWSDEGHLNDRQILMKYWADFSNFFKLQPLNLICQYFGPEVAFYFAFMGYFNSMLIIPALAGVMSIYYGWLTSSDARNYRTVAICASNITICPPCHYMSVCEYERLNNECHTAHFAYIFDNFTTAMYSIFWCFWSTFIYARWKRNECTLMFRWNLLNRENEVNIRPQFLRRAMRYAGNKTGEPKSKIGRPSIYLSVEDEKQEPGYMRFLRYCASGFIIFMLILVIISVLYLAVLARWLVGLMVGRFDGQFSFQWRIFIVTTVGNLLILLFVCIAEDLFSPLAHYITDFENYRTEEDYEESYVYKYAVLCFITSYSFICYTAFLKGRLFTHPGEEFPYMLVGILHFDQEKIHPHLLSTGYQWTIMVIGKEAWRLWRGCKRSLRAQKTKNYKGRPKRIWEKEYALETHKYSFLLEENMKLMIQYGYLVLFPGANPLAPLFIFIYNLWVLRYEAKRALAKTRRVVPHPCIGFGPWLKIMKMITFVGMGINIFFMAFATNLVPEICHWFNPYYTNFIDFTFSQYAVDDYPTYFGDEIKKGREGTICYYRGLRYPPDHPEKYANQLQHWNLVSARFLFILTVQTFVIIFCGLIIYASRDMPLYIKESIRHRNNMKANEREARFRRDKARRSTKQEDVGKNFTVIKL